MSQPRAPRPAAAPRFMPGVRRVLHYLGPQDEPWATLVALAILAGLASGVAAVGLRSSVHLLFHALNEWRTGWLAVALPAAGALLSVSIVTLLFRERDAHGVPQVIQAVCRGGGRMRKRGILSLWIGGLVNVSAGGSAGLESPIVYTGASIGSTIGRLFRLDERQRSVLLACGVAGGISAIFNAPMTGMIFALEVVLVEWSALIVVPVIVSAVAATEVSRLVLGSETSFLDASFSMGVNDLLACAALGLCAGVASVSLVRGIGFFARYSHGSTLRRFVAPTLLGLGVGGIGLFSPAAIGEGYDTAVAAIGAEGLHTGLWLCIGATLAKLVASSMTLGSGAPGGVFAPCLVIGALLGASFYRVVLTVFPAAALGPEGSYALVGMAGLVAGVMQAPLTGILLVMEVTGGYEVILPLMIVAVISLLFVRHFDRYGIYTRELAERGLLLRLGTDRRILSDIDLREALDQDVSTLGEELTLAAAIEVIKTSRRNVFPVVDGESGAFVGLFDVTTARELLYDPDVARLTLVSSVMDPDPPTVPLSASLTEAVTLFEETGAWVLPVLDGGRFVGLLSKSTLFDRYRYELSVQAP